MKPINYARRLWLMLIAMTALTGSALLFNFLVNPFGAWRHRLISQTYYRVRAGHDRVITPYLLRSTRPNTVMFGTSRVLMGMPIEQGMKNGFLNAAMAAARLQEISKAVAIALKNPGLKRIIWGVDFFAFDQRLKSNPETFARLGGSWRLLIQDNLLSTEAFDSSYHLLGRAVSGRKHLDRRVLEPIPWPADYICDRFAHYPERGLAAYGDRGALPQVMLEMPLYRGAVCCDAGLARFKAVIDEIRRAHVQPIIFIPPLSRYELEAIRQGGDWPRFQQWKRDLAQITPYWDFSGYNQISGTDTMFMDILHMKPEAGMTILRRLLGDGSAECPGMKTVLDSGFWVDRNNVDQVLAIQEQREQAAIEEPNKYSEVVAKAITQSSQTMTSASNQAFFNASGP
jgi:hypothetical protein